MQISPTTALSEFLYLGILLKIFFSLRRRRRRGGRSTVERCVGCSYHTAFSSSTGIPWCQPRRHQHHRQLIQTLQMCSLFQQWQPYLPHSRYSRWCPERFLSLRSLLRESSSSGEGNLPSSRSAGLWLDFPTLSSSAQRLGEEGVDTIPALPVAEKLLVWRLQYRRRDEIFDYQGHVCRSRHSSESCVDTGSMRKRSSDGSKARRKCGGWRGGEISGQGWKSERSVIVSIIFWIK